MVDTVTVQADRDCHRLTEAPNVIAHGITVGGVHASMDAHLQPQHAMPLLATSPAAAGSRKVPPNIISSYPPLDWRLWNAPRSYSCTITIKPPTFPPFSQVFETAKSVSNPPTHGLRKNGLGETESLPRAWQGAAQQAAQRERRAAGERRERNRARVGCCFLPRVLAQQDLTV